MSDSETPWITARQASLSITNSRSLLKPMPMESVMPSSHLILCRPLLLLPPSLMVIYSDSACLLFHKLPKETAHLQGILFPLRIISQIFVDFLLDFVWRHLVSYSPCITIVITAFFPQVSSLFSPATSSLHANPVCALFPDSSFWWATFLLQRGLPTTFQIKWKALGWHSNHHTMWFSLLSPTNFLSVTKTSALLLSSHTHFPWLFSYCLFGVELWTLLPSLPTHSVRSSHAPNQT